MSPRHFANLYSERSHRHDSKRDIEIFHDDMQTITGMLYSIITLRCFFPSTPPPQMNHYPVKDAASGDLKYTQLTLW